MYQAGLRLLAEGSFDVVYITTTAFNLFALGPWWKRKTGVPYVLDFQDPWFRKVRARPTTRHQIKQAIGNRTASVLERFAVEGAAGLVAVSNGYLVELARRYPGAGAFRRGRNWCIPFGWRPEDLEAHPARAGRPRGSPRKIAYVGVGGDVMRGSFRCIVESMARIAIKSPDLLRNTRIWLQGTQGGWREGNPKILRQEAESAGLGWLVDEDPRIVSFSSAMAVASRSDGLLVLGVDDPAYMPSKLFPYASTGAPLLACLHLQSEANGYFKRFPELGSLVSFGTGPNGEAAVDQTISDFLRQVSDGARVDRRRSLAEFHSDALGRRHAELFSACISSSEAQPAPGELGNPGGVEPA